MLNRFECIGHIGQKPEIKTLDNGTKVASFSVAVTKRGYTTAAGVQVPERTTWINIIAWRGLAEVVEKYTDKGSHVYVAGELTNRSYEKDGITRYLTEIVADNIELLSRKQEQQSTAPDNSVQDWANQQPAGNSNTAANDFLSQGGAGTGSELPF